MRRMIVTLSIVLAAMAIGAGAATAAENCMIGDAALCAANPDCHWDFQRRGCEPGAPSHADARAARCNAGPRRRGVAWPAHEGKDICNGDTTIGCKWNADKGKCESAH